MAVLQLTKGSILTLHISLEWLWWVFAIDRDRPIRTGEAVMRPRHGTRSEPCRWGWPWQILGVGQQTRELYPAYIIIDSIELR